MITDWLGNEYGPGDRVLYAAGSGRSITMVLGEVIDAYRVYRDQDTSTWKRLDEGENPPLRRVWSRDLKELVDSDKPVDSEHRVRVRPLGSSRWEQHSFKRYYVDTRTGKRMDPWSQWPSHVETGAYRADESGNRTSSSDYSPGTSRVPLKFNYYVEEHYEGEIRAVTITVTENVVRVPNDFGDGSSNMYKNPKEDHCG